VLSEQIVAPETGLDRIPDGLSYPEAATLPCAAVTAWGALFERGRPLKAGNILLLQGTGGVALFGLQLAKAVGA
jgi:NADPH:quinone reductase-like Zn-dependent oxidoreductase